ncbi:MAG: hypothetical protein ACO1OF_16385 [Adhaeribacter sp.]
MALLTPTAFFNRYQNIFADNSTGNISEEDLRDFVSDIIDSFVFVGADPDNAGDSAYEIWLQQGNQGSAADFLASLRGGNAYEAWLEAGYTGTLEQFLQTLVGASAYDIWIAQGNTGNQAAFLASLKGAPGYTPQKEVDYFDGKTAYQVAQEEGFTGTPAEWLASLKGADGKNALFVTILAELTELPQSGQSGYGYVVNNDLWIWLIGSATWYNAGPLAGIPGPQGPIGKSAYQVWLEIPGNEGKTLQQYLNSLKGADGRSAYQIAQANGYAGTEAQWLVYLKGYTPQKGIDYTDGANGKSAYQLAVDNGYSGTLTQWLASLKGYTPQKGVDYNDGADGRSAYQIAVSNGFAGTEAQWLESLKGNGVEGQEEAANDTYYGKNKTGEIGFFPFPELQAPAAKSYKIAIQPITNISEGVEPAATLKRVYFGPTLTTLQLQVNGGAIQTLTPTGRVWSGTIALPANATLKWIPTASATNTFWIYATE